MTKPGLSSIIIGHHGIGVIIMLLDLKKIIAVPGRVSFEYEPDISDMSFSSVVKWLSPLHAVGEVVNTAGALTLTASLSVKMLCLCDRCGTEFEKDKLIPVEAKLAGDLEDPDNPDIFPIADDAVDLDEVLITAFVLGMDTKFLCSEDCPGLCPKCGKPLRDGPCGCEGEKDPRLAVLEQLLDQ